jgi:hypothetical protein
MQEYKS